MSSACDVLSSRPIQRGLAPARCCGRLCSSVLHGFSQTRFIYCKANTASLFPLLYHVVVDKLKLFLLSPLKLSSACSIFSGMFPVSIHAQQEVADNSLAVWLLFFKGSTLHLKKQLKTGPWFLALQSFHKGLERYTFWTDINQCHPCRLSPTVTAKIFSDLF